MTRSHAHNARLSPLASARTVSEHDCSRAAVRCCAEHVGQRRLVCHFLGRDRQPQGGQLHLGLSFACRELGGRLQVQEPNPRGQGPGPGRGGNGRVIGACRPEGNTPTLGAEDEEDAEAHVCMLSCLRSCCGGRGTWRSLTGWEVEVSADLDRR